MIRLLVADDHPIFRKGLVRLLGDHDELSVVAEELVLVIHRLVQGRRYVCSAIAERLAMGIAMQDSGEQPHTRLTEREFKIFEMLVAGRRGWEIAGDLALSEKTVSTHKTNVLRKLQATNRTELVLYAIRHQLIPV
jgi:DNA-binding NarL/FixJ family response regulator